MKIAEPSKPNRLFAKDRRGVALITVLTVLALTTILVLTFFSLATSEHRASYTYSHGLQAQQVAEQAVNMVIAQIREATTVGTSKAWASQPGAIRVWDEGGNQDFAYKLYSDDKMKTENWFDFQEDFVDMGAWIGRPDHYVDLNEPVIRGEKVYFPIVHPAASTVPKWPKPIGSDSDGVEGFSFNKREGRVLSANGSHGDTAARIAGSTDGHVAMPVKWIYQLADGTLGVLNDAASGGGGMEGYTFIRTSGTGTPSERNPIVARFAFWADDETTKLNINTHAGGLAWDIPKAGGELDMNMGKYQPAQKEWQRYPGHPASTHLIPALAPGVLDIVNDRDAMEMLYRVVPRIVGGGSESGTRVIDTRRKEEENGLIADKEPLFPTIDDIIMRSDREPHEFPDAKGRPIPPRELSEYLERSKFFITANSRAPETNIFNLPRVAIWPIYNAAYDDPDYKEKLTPFDRLIHYCASMGENTNGWYPRHEYIFRREDADSATHDYDRIDRNIALYNYLRDLLERSVPGYGDSFASKYSGGGHEQILTQIFDYIRTTNLHDDSLFEDFQQAFVPTNTPDTLAYTNPRDINNTQVGHKGHGQVVPIRIGETKGFGRFYTLGSVQVHVISCAEPGDIPVPKNMGARSYRGRRDVPPANITMDNEVHYLNFPPHPDKFEPGMPGYENHEPAWLKALRENNPSLYQKAMNPYNWNWQLAFLDPQYRFNALNDPTTGKFNRRALTPLGPGNPFTAGLTRLKDTEQLVQGGLYFNLFTPSIGWGSINPDMEIKIEVLRNSTDNFMYFPTLSLPEANDKAQFLGFVRNFGGVNIVGNEKKDEWIFATNRVDSAWGGRRYGGLMPYEYAMNVPASFTRIVRDRAIFNNTEFNDAHQGTYPNGAERFDFSVRTVQDGQRFMPGYNFDVQGGRTRLTPLDRGYNYIEGTVLDNRTPALTDKNAQSYRYDLVTIPFKIENAEVRNIGAEKVFFPGDVVFKGGDLKFTFYHGGERAELSAPTGNVNSYGADIGEVIQEVTVEIPDFEISQSKSNNTNTGMHPKVYDRNLNSLYGPHLSGNYNEFDDLDKDSFSYLERVSLGSDPGNPYITADGGTGSRGRDPRITVHEPGNRFRARSVPTGRMAHLSVHHRPALFSPQDVVQSVEVRHGDARIVAGRAEVKKREVFAPHRLYDKNPMAHSTTNAVGGAYPGAQIDKDYIILTHLGADPYRGRVPLPFGVEKSNSVQLYGDFDNGSGLMIDGPYINKPDEGNIHSLKGKWMRQEQDYWEFRRNRGEFPYFNTDWLHETGGPAYFSPNRLVSGPGMFGSLPTGVLTDDPWRTLLFRPEMKSGGEAGFRRHPGADSPPDHLIMDLFWMPVVEPYAISEPLSTGGKVNLNFDIMPFLHIQRSTALYGVLRSEMMLCIPNRWHTDYKHDYGRGRGYHWRDNPYGGALQGKRLRSVILEEETVEQFFDRFNDGADAFKSATEICDLHLIPQEVTERLGGGGQGAIGSYQPSVSDMDNGKYWKDHALVGDNSRERPYTNIQTRLTTKSNTFLVHYRAQVLKQSRRESEGEYGIWRPMVDSVQAEYRGSSMVERYVNPESKDIPDLAHGSADGLDAYYRYRVVNPKRFAP